MDKSDPRTRDLARRMQIEDHGTLEQQKDAIIAEILTAFRTPERWPATDPDRIALLQKLYRMALTIEFCSLS